MTSSWIRSLSCANAEIMIEASAVCGEDLNCLLVDDREENLFAHEALLRDTGARILKAKCGDEALDLLLRHDFAVALIDVQMPGMDGIELAETMRSTERTRNVPIIFLTAAKHDESKILRGYRSGGAVDFLCKPIMPDVVRTKVNVFLEIARRRRALNANLERVERALEQAEAAGRDIAEVHAVRDHLLAIVGHDLRTPLSVVLLTARMIEESSACPGRSDCIRRIIRSSERMRGIIEEMVDLSHAQHGSFRVTRVKIDAVAVIRDVIAEILVVHPGCTIELRGEPSVVGLWDRRLLGQVCSNLVGNAVVHGGNTPVTVNVSRDDGHVMIEVHNGGSPIPESLLPQVFDPYRRAHEDTSDHLGLGLYISRAAVRAHEGEITVHSTYCEGTTFTVRLPCAAPRLSLGAC